ncbi:peptide transporter [Gallibacterium salpingitidis]|uniref:Peptide transporter n=1 Tax=Gallibacterium salpingitidis TaxID=505341 RepID=A0AB36E1P5_9PAST|nr:ShlB/FhaC/HecB family hemolysin secretion/activation protein [Gallibacterium salpingitidis]OBX06745.1 peptide transporter [Gallibacterium salpingitidis]OBX09663.1 peptide transporter [Gallibacterium salpingitidis]WKS99485.1 ShlB/FhaC/HecB family hemolysin secretion/activation protein [Gallibacterium salpingitidis]
MHNRLTLSLIVFFFPLTGIAAQSVVHADQQFQRQQLEQQQKLEQLTETPAVRLSTEHLTVNDTNTAISNTPCFPIQHIDFIDYDVQSSSTKPEISPSRFSTLLQNGTTLPICLTEQTLNQLLTQWQNKLIDRGFITTRVLVQPQDLRQGKLTVTVVLGRISRLQLQDQSEFPKATNATIWFAMPMKQGDLLNLRDLETGLENLRRNSSVKANIELFAHPEQIGGTDVVIAFQQGNPFSFTLSLDDAGSKATGRFQASAALSAENLFSWNDLLYGSVTRSIKTNNDDNKEDHGSQNLSFYYALPWKNWLFTLSHSTFNYHQTIPGAFEKIEYSGKSIQWQANLSRLLYRDAQRKTTLTAGFWSRRSFNYVDGDELAIQRRRMAGWQAHLNHTEYLGNAIWQFQLGYKQGTGADRALAAPEELFNEGTSRPKIFNAKIQFTYPFMLGKQPWQLHSEWQAQWNKTPLIQQDKFSIGGRYTVRGFDGELTLSGEHGWFWRNELAWNIANRGHQLYFALDHGRVDGRSTEDLLGKQLTGGAIGLKGKLFGFNYDVFAGAPINKPQGFQTSRITTGFNLSYQF